MDEEGLSHVEEIWLKLDFALDIFNETTDRKLTLGEKIYIVQATRSAFELPYSSRPGEMDTQIRKLISFGVIDYRIKERGVDSVADYFYSNPARCNSAIWANR